MFVTLLDSNPFPLIITGKSYNSTIPRILNVYNIIDVFMLRWLNTGVRLKCGSGTERMRNGTDEVKMRNGTERMGLKCGTERNGYGVKMRNGTDMGLKCGTDMGLKCGTERIWVLN